MKNRNLNYFILTIEILLNFKLTLATSTILNYFHERMQQMDGMYHFMEGL